MRVYADNAATTYLSKTARDKLIQCLDEFNGNPNSLHSDGQRTQEALDEARETVARCINAARPNEIYFTSGGSEADKLTEELKKITDKEVQINIFEVKRPELDAQIVASTVARQIEGKIAYRRAVKMAIASTMRSNAEGIKIQISGRLNGAEMARSEMFKEGRTPLHTLRADIDYALVEAHTKVGVIGVKVWICRGEVYGKRDLAPSFTASAKEGRGSNNGAPRRGNFRKPKNNR